MPRPKREPIEEPVEEPVEDKPEEPKEIPIQIVTQDILTNAKLDTALKQQEEIINKLEELIKLAEEE